MVRHGQRVTEGTLAMVGTLTPGMSVTLVRLTVKPHLNGTTVVLQKYLSSRSMWAVELPNRSVFAVSEENMLTRDILAQAPYGKYGFPMQGQPSFADLVQERHGQHGRYLVASRHIRKGTYAKDNKVHTILSYTEIRELADAFEVFVEHSLPALMGVSGPIDITFPHESQCRVSAFVGRFMIDAHTDNALMQDLMAFDHLTNDYLQQAMQGLVLCDVLWFEFWRITLQRRFSADVIWKNMTFLLSHALLHDNHMLTFGLFSKAQCPQKRWNSYQQGVSTPFILGNIEDVPPWGVQSEVRLHQIPGDQCILFCEDVHKGAPITMDYGPMYMPKPEEQLRQYHKHELRKVIEAVMRHLDPRVMQALSRHMQT